MIKIGEFEFYASWIKDLHGYIVRVSGPSLYNDKREMIVTLIPEKETINTLVGLSSFLNNTEENSFIGSLNDQFGTKIEVIRHLESTNGSNRYVYKLHMKSGQLDIHTDITQEQFEILEVNAKANLHDEMLSNEMITRVPLGTHVIMLFFYIQFIFCQVFFC